MHTDSHYLKNLATHIRRLILKATTTAGSGHPTSSLSATDLLTTLFFGGYLRLDLDNHDYHNNDRFILSKGHASPLLYALYAAAGSIDEEELLTLRDFESPLEGHPTNSFPYADVATGSLGQGLSVGVGMALNAKYLDQLPYQTYVLLGDSEMAEGSNWEAIQIASHYQLQNLIGILDVNRLGQRGETMYGHDLAEYAAKLEAFGWETRQIDGHAIDEIAQAFAYALEDRTKPLMIIARTVKGKGVSFLEDSDGWHGKVLEKEQLQRALAELDTPELALPATVTKPALQNPALPTTQPGGQVPSEDYQEPLATRKAYGHALVTLGQHHQNLVVLDAEVSNSTYSETFKQAFPDRFFEMFIAEQNMVGVAMGLAARGKIPFVSTFATFFTRAFDQIRVSQYSDTNINFVGSHAGVSIGEDGPTQMGLEDIAMFRALHGSTVLYPADHASTEELVSEMVDQPGIVYLRTTRASTPNLYHAGETFPIGGSKTLRSSESDQVTLIAAGITLHQALEAHEALQAEGIHARVIDLYSVKPFDTDAILRAAADTKHLVVVEDHYPEGGIGEAVAGVLSEATTKATLAHLAVHKRPRSGEPAELLAFEEIDAQAIVEVVKKLLT